MVIVGARRKRVEMRGRRMTWLITLGSWMSFSSTQATSFSLNLLQHFIYRVKGKD